MNDTKYTADYVLQIGTVIKPCPCCAGHGTLTRVPDEPKFGVRCTGCPLTFPEVYDVPENAVHAWSQRRGTVSAAGGRGTRGRCSWRKCRSCRKNLKLARDGRKLNLIKTRLLVMIPWLQALRAYEWANSEDQKARAWAAIKAMEPEIMAVPVLRAAYKLLIRQSAPAGAE